MKVNQKAQPEKHSAKYLRLPILILNISRWLTMHGLFWFVVAACAIVEPIICSFYPTGNILIAQVVVLSAGSLLFAIQLIGLTSTEWEKILATEGDLPSSYPHSKTIFRRMNHMPLLQLLIFFTSEGEMMLEFSCLVIGWVCIFHYPGIAILRCFRILRLLW